MDVPTKRVRKIVEHVIDTEGGIDAKQFSFSVKMIHDAMQTDGVDLGYDDAYTVTATEGEIIFSYEKVKD